MHRRPREARRRGHRRARREHAVVGALRAAGRAIPRERAPAPDRRARRRRGGRRDRLGALRRNGRGDHRHALVRRLRAVQGPDEEIRIHARGGGARREGAARKEETHEPRQGASRSRPGRLARFPLARVPREGRAREAHRARRRAGRNLEPDDLREGDRPLERLRRVHPAASRGRPPGRADPRVADGRGHPACGRRAASGLRGDARRRRLRQHRGLALPRRRHATHDRGGEAAVARGRPREPHGEGPGDEGRIARDPRDDGAGHQCEHHIAVFAEGL